MFPVPAVREMLGEVDTYVAWPSSTKSPPPAVAVLFHGCNCQGSDWFRKPEEVHFLNAAQARGLAVVAFTSPRHLGNFCWANQGTEEFEEAADGVLEALLKVLEQHRSEEAGPMPLLLVGGSSGGNFASLLPPRWSKSGRLDGLAKISAFLCVISPTSYVRRGFQDHDFVGQPPPSDYPPTGFVYMPRDTAWASQAAITLVQETLMAQNIPSKAWPILPSPISAQLVARSLRSANVPVADEAAAKFTETLQQLGLLTAKGEVLSDPRRFPWHRAAWMLAEGQDFPKGDRNADPMREHRIRCVEEVLNRGYAQHEFASQGIADEVWDWLLQQKLHDSASGRSTSTRGLTGDLRM